MQDELELKMSMLLDGELDPKEAVRVLDQIKDDRDLRRKWLRYNCVSSVFKREPGYSPDMDFFDRVCSTLEDESVVEFSVWSASRRWLRRPSFALALAASLAVIGIVSWWGISSPLNSSPDAVSPMIAAVQKNGTVGGGREAQRLATTPNVSRRLNDYLIMHNGSSRSGGTQGFVPYARVVSYSSTR
jgi:sigma-E factor negative regulatory protein RseA